MRTKKTKIDIDALFMLILGQAVKVKGFTLTESEMGTLRTAFHGLFRKGQTGFLRTPPPNTGYLLSDGSVDVKRAVQSVRSSFCKLFLYHMGRLGNNAGPLIDASFNLRFSGGALMADCTDNGANFVDACDTFIQVFVYILNDGRVSSLPGADWRRAFGYND